MPSYTQYMRQMAVMDANDDDIESWITVKGNHIPIKKGQSKEDAVKEFISKKSDKEFSKRAEKPQSIGEATKKVVSQVKENREINKAAKKEYPAEFETVRKNAKANPYLYDLRYTQKSKAKAYEEYKKDTEKKEEKPDFNKLSDSYFDTWEKLGVKSGSEIYSDAKKAREFYKEFKSKIDGIGEGELTDKDFDEHEEMNHHLLNSILSLSGKYGKKRQEAELDFTKRHDGSGCSIPYEVAQEIVGSEKLAGSSGTKAPKVTKVDAKKWNSPASDPWKSLYD